jgi:hypothetical protein
MANPLLFGGSVELVELVEERAGLGAQSRRAPPAGGSPAWWRRPREWSSSVVLYQLGA